MSVRLRIIRAAPSSTVQDAGRFGALQHGVGASGPMDREAFENAGALLQAASTAGIEFTRAGLDVVVEGDGTTRAAFAGGDFLLRINGRPTPWGAAASLQRDDRLEVTPGPAGNYGYVRFDHEIDVPMVMGSRATSLVAGLGGLKGRALAAGDILPLKAAGAGTGPAHTGPSPSASDAPIRFVWGIHAELFTPGLRQAFAEKQFRVSDRLDRMGVRLVDESLVFAGRPILSLVSDAIVAGDIQILGDGTPIVLMRDHQPTGGYPRIATVISADLDRFAQMRPGARLAFEPVTLHKARFLYLASRAR